MHDSENTVLLNILLKKMSSWPSWDNRWKVVKGFHITNSAQLSYLLSVLVLPFIVYLGISAISTSLSMRALSSCVKELAKKRIGAISIFLSYRWNPGFPPSLPSPMKFHAV